MVKTINVGDYATVEDIGQQTTGRWVVIRDLIEDEEFGVTDGGVIACIADTKKEAGDFEFNLQSQGIDTLLVSEATGGLHIGGIFVE